MEVQGPLQHQRREEDEHSEDHDRRAPHPQTNDEEDAAKHLEPRQ